MSALHRQMLKRGRAELGAYDGYAPAEAGLPSASRSGAPSAPAESSRASADLPAMTPSCASARGSSGHQDGTIFVAPESGDEEAELGDGVSHQTPATAGFRRAAHAAQAAAEAEPCAAPAEAFLAENLQQRLAAMFLAGPGAPRPSGMKQVADAAQLWLLVAVKTAAHAFWEAHEEQARSCCKPSLLSETEVRGYLANDALGNPLLPPGYGAHCPDAVGKRVSNGVVKATKVATAARKTARDMARTAARKGGAVDADAAEKAAQAALAAEYDLQLPGVGRRAEHKTPALMSPHELSMAGGGVEVEQLMQHMHDAAKAAETAALKAERSRTIADAADSEAERLHHRYMSLGRDSSKATQAAALTKADVAAEHHKACEADSDAAAQESQEAAERHLDAVRKLECAVNRWVDHLDRQERLLKSSSGQKCPFGDGEYIYCWPCSAAAAGLHLRRTRPKSGCLQDRVLPNKHGTVPMSWDHRRRRWVIAFNWITDISTDC